MGGTPVVVDVPRPRIETQTKTPPKTEAPQSKDGKKAVEQFAKMVEVAIVDKNKTTEALAGIAGWRIMAKIDPEITKLFSQVSTLLKDGKISNEKAEDYFKRMGDISKSGIAAQSEQNRFAPSLQNLNEVVGAEVKSGTIGPFMRDLNYHYIKYDIKRLEGNDDPNAKSEHEQLKGDLIESEKERGDLKPENDEIVKFSLALRGEKKLPEKFKDSPLEAIDDFFQHKLKNIVKNEKTRVQMAQRLGVTPDDLTNLVAVYENGNLIDRQMNALDNIF